MKKTLILLAMVSSVTLFTGCAALKGVVQTVRTGVNTSLDVVEKGLNTAEATATAAVNGTKETVQPVVDSTP